MTRHLQQMIHVGCRDLGIDADARHDLQLRVVGKASMSDMNAAELQKVVNELKRQGFKPSSNGRSKERRTHKLAPRGDLRVIHVLWSKLGQKGVLDRPGRDGLNAFIRKQFGESWASVPADVDMIRDPKQIQAVISALEAWGKRAEIDYDFGRRG
ncbi:gp16 family protein [Thalassococcus sp. S3]|uniref:gp16 family protein n=1 Tax=Thalassococcus sp. S3 TaxID=2017482 RepID=UPI0010248942|nr:regulatory protein GemA [Thalassococcus sp. S3]QBF31521.1 GemA protein [Thalassococcus sp. S3]